MVVGGVFVRVVSFVGAKGRGGLMIEGEVERRAAAVGCRAGCRFCFGDVEALVFVAVVDLSFKGCAWRKNWAAAASFASLAAFCLATSAWAAATLRGSVGLGGACGATGGFRACKLAN